MITDLDVGGAERAMVNLAIRLDRRRWNVQVITLAAEGPLAHVLEQEHIRWQCLGCTHHQPVQVMVRLIRALRAFQPQLIQSFLFHANLASRLAGLCAGQPWVISGLRVAERQKRWHIILDRLSAPLTTGSVCVSQGVAKFSHDVGGLNTDRLTVIPNGIDPIRFDEASPLPREYLGIPNQTHLVLFVGRLAVQKGISHLIQAARIVIPQRPSWHLAIAGDGPYRDRLLTEIRMHDGLINHVHWLGSRDDIPALLRTADVLVLPSLWEGMPNVILEAMAASRPVIATAIEGTTELVIPGETGWLVSPGNSQDLSVALLEATTNPERLLTFGRKGRERVAKYFSLDQTVLAYDRLWSQILGFQGP